VRRLVDVNFVGVVWGMQAALDAFGAQGGDIVNVASASALGPVPGLSVYAATKAAVASLTMSVALETAKQVRVHAVCPDGVDTEMVRVMRDEGQAKALVHSGGRLLTVEEVATEVVAMIGSRRVLRTLPAWRAPLIRVGHFLPSQSRGAFKAFEVVGRRVMSRRGSSGSR
jgi:NAD(P)-dependent dehydrogenase (short-subunit alcohol dehydrogenase family)